MSWNFAKRSVVATALVSAICPAPADARPDVDSNADANVHTAVSKTQANHNETEPTWGLDAGLNGGFGVRIMALGDPSYTLSNYISPGVSTAIERKIDDRRWLLVAMRASHYGDTFDGERTANYSAMEQTSVGAAVGLRQRMVEISPVDISLFGLVGADFDRAKRKQPDVFLDDSTAMRITRNRSVGAHADCGVMVDYELAHNLALRLSTPIISARYRIGEQAIGYAHDNSEDRGEWSTTSLDARLQPNLAMHFSW